MRFSDIDFLSFVDSSQFVEVGFLQLSIKQIHNFLLPDLDQMLKLKSKQQLITSRLLKNKLFQLYFFEIKTTASN